MQKPKQAYNTPCLLKKINQQCQNGKCASTTKANTRPQNNSIKGVKTEKSKPKSQKT